MNSSQFWTIKMIELEKNVGLGVWVWVSYPTLRSKHMKFGLVCFITHSTINILQMKYIYFSITPQELSDSIYIFN